jgi:hypothetical protein
MYNLVRLICLFFILIPGSVSADDAEAFPASTSRNIKSSSTISGKIFVSLGPPKSMTLYL